MWGRETWNSPFCSLGFFLSSTPLESSLSLSSSLPSSSDEASPFVPSSSLLSSPESPSASLSGAPNGFAGLSLLSASPGLPKLRRGPETALPPNALAKGLDLNTDPLACPLRPANGEEAAAPPKLSFGGADGAAGWEPPRTPPREEDPDDAPNRLGFPDPPKLPNGEVEEAASLAKPELANAEADVCVGCSAGLVLVVVVESLPSACSMLDLGDALAERGSLFVLPGRNSW